MDLSILTASPSPWFEMSLRIKALRDLKKKNKNLHLLVLSRYIAHSYCKFIHRATLRGELNSLITNTEVPTKSYSTLCISSDRAKGTKLITFKNQDEGQHETQNFTFILQ